METHDEPMEADSVIDVNNNNYYDDDMLENPTSPSSMHSFVEPLFQDAGIEHTGYLEGVDMEKIRSTPSRKTGKVDIANFLAVTSVDGAGKGSPRMAIRKMKHELRKKHQAMITGEEPKNFLEQIMSEEETKQEEFKYASIMDADLDLNYSVYNYGTTIMEFFQAVKAGVKKMPTFDKDYIDYCYGKEPQNDFPLDLNAPCQVQVHKTPHAEYLYTDSPRMAKFSNAMFVRCSDEETLVLHGRRSDYFRPMKAASSRHIFVTQEKVPDEALVLKDRIFVRELPTDKRFKRIFVLPAFFDHVSTQKKLNIALGRYMDLLSPGGNIYLVKPLMSDYSTHSVHRLLQRAYDPQDDFSLVHFGTPSGKDYMQYDVPLSAISNAVYAAGVKFELQQLQPLVITGISAAHHSVQFMSIENRSHLDSVLVRWPSGISGARFVAVADADSLELVDASYRDRQDTIPDMDYVDLLNSTGKSLMWTKNYRGTEVYCVIKKQRLYARTPYGVFVMSKPVDTSLDVQFRGILRPMDFSMNPYLPPDQYEGFNLFIVDLYEKTTSFSGRIQMMNRIFDTNPYITVCPWRYMDDYSQFDTNHYRGCKDGILVASAAEMHRNRHIYRHSDKPPTFIVDADTIDLYPGNHHLVVPGCRFYEVREGNILYARWDLTLSDNHQTINEKMAAHPSLSDILNIACVKKVVPSYLDIATWPGIKGATSAAVFNQDAGLGQLLVSTYPTPLRWSGADLIELTRAIVIRHSRYVTVPGSNDHLQRLVKAFSTISQHNPRKRNPPLYVPKSGVG